MAERAFQRTLWLLALTTWVFYAVTATGTLSADPYTRFDVAENLLSTGEVTANPARGLTVEHDGRHYSVFFPGQSILFLPPAALSVIASEWFGVGPELATIAARFAACVFIIPAFGALGLLGQVAVLRSLHVSPRIALCSGAILAFGTPLWVWGSNASEETTLAALAVWALWAILQAGRIARSEIMPTADDRARALAFTNRIGLAGILLAFGMIHRSTFIAVVVGAAILALPILFRNLRLIALAKTRFTLWTLAATTVIAILPLYNWIRFDDLFDTGYGTFYSSVGGVFANPLHTGLIGHLFSPGKSVFLYAPWLVLLPFALALRTIRRRMGPLTWSLLAIIVIHLVIYSLHTYWAGAFGWAVRFHVSLMPLLLIPIAVWLDRIPMKPLIRSGLAALAVASICIQLAGHSLNTGLEHLQHPEDYTGYNGLIPADAAWTWRGSQLRLRFVNIADKLRGQPLLDLDDQTPHKIREVWNIFPLRAAFAFEDRSIVFSLWLLWIALLGIGCFSARRTIKCFRALPPPKDTWKNASRSP